MKIIPAGKYESALVRLVDEIVMPDRNVTGHSYYMDLNRAVDRKLVDGVGTFVALAEETIVPWELDWHDPKERTGSERIELGVSRSLRPDRDDEEDHRRYQELDELNKSICASGVLSAQSLEYITSLDLSGYPENVIKRWNENVEDSRSQTLSGYLRRLLHQIYTAPNISSCYVLAAEPDIRILAEIGDAIFTGRLKTGLPFPDLRNRLIEPNAFAHGVLNFSPKDIRSVEHVRSDGEVRGYAKQIQALLNQGPAGPEDPTITDAMIDAYYRTEAGRKARTVFEIGTWLVKPLHYVPVVGEVLSVVEDLKDVAQKAAERKLKQYEWFLVGVRMHELAVKDYLERLSNNLHPALRNYRDGNM